ncbi:MAG: cyclic nucleotide-binding domain-containing protein, partial [Candidatus Zixiibacteriota bacterium]
MTNQPDLSATIIKRGEQFRDRWSSYGEHSGIAELSERLSPQRLAEFELLQEYDEKFLKKISPDISLAVWKAGAVLYEEGSYIDVAFFVVEGRVSVQAPPRRSLADQVRPIYDTERTMVRPTGELPPVDSVSDRTVFQDQISRAGPDTGQVTFLATMDINVAGGQSLTLGEGSFVGELGASIGWPQPATALTASECTLLQIRMPALKQLKRKSSALKNRIDKLYRDNALLFQLQSAPLFQGCDNKFLEELKDRVELVSCEANEVIAAEEAPADSLFLVRSGFVKLSQNLERGPLVVTYLSKGMTLGEVELMIDGVSRWRYGARSVESAELVKISRADFERLILRFPQVRDRLWRSAVARIKESGYGRRDIRHSQFLDTALKEGMVEGSSILAIDLDVCTRCDDCVRACAATHGGTPRFIREGSKYQNLLITRACNHCRDPVCLIGCPTGAIRRSGAGDVVEIDDALCIGCRACANNCPY